MLLRKEKGGRKNINRKGKQGRGVHESSRSMLLFMYGEGCEGEERGKQDGWIVSNRKRERGKPNQKREKRSEIRNQRSVVVLSTIEDTSRTVENDEGGALLEREGDGEGRERETRTSYTTVRITNEARKGGICERKRKRKGTRTGWVYDRRLLFELGWR